MMSPSSTSPSPPPSASAGANMQAALQAVVLTEYEGERSPGSGRCHGSGHGTFASGQSYDGCWERGAMHGAPGGTLTFPDGIVYAGTMAHNRISGTGVYRWPGATYEGEVQDGLRHGFGTLTFAHSPVSFRGEWAHGKRHGRGVLTYDQEQRCFYDGAWVADMRQGEGRSVYPSGNSYCGGWVADRQEGIGTMSWLAAGQTYTGQWAGGRPNGLGEHTWRTPQQRSSSGGSCAGAAGAAHAVHVMHNRYVGMLADGQRQGVGVLFYSNGARYEGEWATGRKHGQGVFVFEDGSCFVGRFVDDWPDVAAGCMLGADSTWPCCTADGGGGRGSDSNSSGSGGGGSGSGAVRPESCTHTAARLSTESPDAAACAPTATAATPKRASAQSSRAKPAGSGSTQRARAPSASAATTASTPASSQTNKAQRPAASATVAAADQQVPALSPPGFGPSVFALQLYIGDLLPDYEAAPVASCKALANLLVAHNTELRTLYDRYSTHASPLASSSANSWALCAGQLWQLLADARLLCATVTLSAVCDMIRQAVAPPPAVMQCRQQLRAAAGAAFVEVLAAASPPMQRFEADTQLLYRDFCEVVVRLAAARYPTLPSLEQQLGRVLGHHLMPLLGSSSRQLASGARASILSSAAAAAAAAGSASATAATCGSDRGTHGHTDAGLLHSAGLCALLREHAGLLKRLFAAIAGQQQPGHAACTAPAPASAASGSSDANARPASARQANGNVEDDTVWRQQSVTARQVVAYLEDAGLLARWELSPEAVAAALLHDMLALSDSAVAHACIDLPDDIDGSCWTAAQQASSSSGAAAAADSSAALVFWMDCPLLLQELLWGLVRLAAVGGCSSSELTQRVHDLLLGEHGVLTAFLPSVKEPLQPAEVPSIDAGEADEDAGLTAALDAVASDINSQLAELEGEDGAAGSECEAAEACNHAAEACNHAAEACSDSGAAVLQEEASNVDK